MSQEDPSLELTVSIKVKVDPDWVDYCVRAPDLFMTDYCGYWMAGMEQDNELGWLCYEYDIGGDHNPNPWRLKKHPEYAAIVQAWREGKPLPERWYRLNKEAAIKAYKCGVERYGVNWYEDGDATTYDVAIQLALLGKIVYG